MTAAQADKALVGFFIPELVAPEAANQALGAQMKAMHFSAVFKGKWTTNSSDGSMQFQGERRIVMQDRYNWEAPEFNGVGGTAEAPIPAAVVKLLPASHQSAFNSGRVNEKPMGRIADSLLAHLQMVKGGAQPFWTVGVGSPTAVDYTVNAQGEWSVTK